MTHEPSQDVYDLGGKEIKSGDIIMIYISKDPMLVRFHIYETRLKRLCVEPLNEITVDYMCVKLKDIKYIATVHDGKEKRGDK
ncbi:MAG: hypothetical protein QXP29_07375 [Candidatus Nezhaarchaeales archaeon]